MEAIAIADTRHRFFDCNTASVVTRLETVALTSFDGIKNAEAKAFASRSADRFPFGIAMLVHD